MTKSETKIVRIGERYKEEFPMGWQDKYEWDGSHCEESMLSAFKKIKDFDREVFCLFSQTVLSGEYLIRQQKVYEQLDNCRDLLLDGEIKDDDTNKNKTRVVNDFNSMLHDLLYATKSFMHLIKLLENNYEDKEDYIVKAYRAEACPHRDDSYHRLYEILINLTRKDHFLSHEDKIKKDLIYYHEELSDYIRNSELDEVTDDNGKRFNLILNIMNQKCLFLLKKLLIEDNKEFVYMTDFKKTRYDSNKLPIEFFSEMDNYFEFYRAQSHQHKHFVRELDVRSDNHTLPIGSYTLLIKYYMEDKDTSMSQIEHIIADFDSLYDELSSCSKERPIDKYSLSVLKNYMYNCRFSFVLKQKKCSLEMLEDELNKIMEIQSKTDIHNFYPYKKAFEKARCLFKTEESLEQEKLNEYKIFMQLCIKKFSEAITWCKNRCFYPIQSRYRECLVRVPGFGPVFVASSFCRPIVYEKL